MIIGKLSVETIVLFCVLITPLLCCCVVNMTFAFAQVTLQRLPKNVDLEALHGQCIPPPRHVLPVSPSSGESVWESDLCPLTTFRIYANGDESGKQSMYPDGDPDRHRNLISCSLANLPWKFHSNPFGSFCAKLQIGKQTNKQRKHILLGGGN